MPPTTQTTTPTAGPSNSPPEYDLDDIARIDVGTLIRYQRQPKTRQGTSIDWSRWRELRSHLNRTCL